MIISVSTEFAAYTFMVGYRGISSLEERDAANLQGISHHGGPGSIPS
jgi:hypothetical protein